MIQIYEVPIEAKIDLLSHSKHSHILREQWLFFDSSIFIRLMNYFVDKKPLTSDFIETFRKLISILSTQNLNIHHITLFEISAKKDRLNIEMNDDLTIKHIQAMLIAQCIDVQASTFETPESWIISQEREKYILSQYPFKANNIEDLSNKIYASYKVGLNKDFFETIENFKNKAAIPHLDAIRNANMLEGNNVKKLNAFFSQIKGLPYCPRIVDYCIRLLILSGEEPLLTGGLKKIKTELQNTALDFALFEMAKICNFSEPFPDIKPIVNFFTCDRNMYYYAQLGHPLEIKLPNLEGSVYYPDLSYLKDRKELIEIVLKYFKINPPEELKELVLEKIMDFISAVGWTENNRVTFESLSKIDFSEFEIYKYYQQYN